MLVVRLAFYIVLFPRILRLRMDVIPAIDLRNGKCVRLYKGLKERSTTYNEDPVEQLFYWEDLGAEVVHIIDLDGAFGEKNNQQIIKRMLTCATARIEVGGGIRSLENALELYSLGVERVIIGTSAIKNPDLVTELADQIGSPHVVVALDYRAGKVLTDGWEKKTEYSVYEVGKLMEQKRAGWILFSSAEADGTLGGPDLQSITQMVQTVKIPVIAAGGISSLVDIQNVRSSNVAALVVGKALYEKQFSYSEALAITKLK